MSTTISQATVASNERATRPFYTRLAALGFGLIALTGLVSTGFALLMGDTVAAAFSSPLLIIGLLIAGALWRFGVWAQVLAGILSLALLGLVLPFSIFNLLHPESGGEFIPLLLLIVGTTFGLIGCVVSLVQRRRHTLRSVATPTESLVLKIILAALAVVSLGSLALTAAAHTTVSAESKANAVSVEIKNFEFSPNRIQAKAGSAVRLVVKNNDATLHTFTLPAAGVDVSVPPGSEKLVEFQAPAPGEYQWYCIPHSGPNGSTRTGMVGTLQVQ